MGLLSRFANAFADNPAQGLFGHVQSQALPVEPFQPQQSSPFGAFTAPMPLQDQVQFQADVQGATPNRAARFAALLKDAGSSLQGGKSDYQGQLRQQGIDDLQTVKLRQMIDATVQDPRERLIALMNPKAWAEQQATNLGAHVLTPGAILNQGGRNVAAAPQVHAYPDQFGAFNPITGETQYGDQRAPSYEEQIRAQIARDNARNQQNIERNREEQARIARDRLGVQRGHYANQDATARQREGRLGSQGGPAGAGGGGGGLGHISTQDLLKALKGK